MGQTRFVNLRYTIPALADLNSVLDYIAAHSPKDARRVQARIQAIIDLLLLCPASTGVDGRATRDHDGGEMPDAPINLNRTEVDHARS